MEKTPPIPPEVNGSAPPGEMFVITDGLTQKVWCVRDLLPEQLVAYAKDVDRQRQQMLMQVQQTVNAAASLTATVAVLNYELDRRARSIAIASAMPAVLTS